MPPPRRTGRRHVVAGAPGRAVRLALPPVPPLGALALAALALAALALGAVPAVRAHGEETGLPPLDVGALLGTWTVDPLLDLALLLAGAAYLLAAARVNARQPRARIGGWRVASWLGGLAISWVALQSAVDVYAATLFGVHMVQHLLLVAVAAPLLLLAAPVTLALRAAPPGLRRGLLLPVLRSWPVRAVSHPIVAWLVFALVMWGSHFSPLFDAALEDQLVHQFEHALYLGSALLFWWPVVGADVGGRRLGFPARIVYLLAALPQNSFLGVAVYFAPQVLYRHYATGERSWGPSPLEDQQLAGALMWVVGDIAFVVAILAVVAAWLADEERRGRLLDARLAAQKPR